MGAAALMAQPVDYDIIYLKAPRYGDETNTKWPEVFHPVLMEPGTDMVLLRPDGTEEVLLDAGNGAVMDPMLSFDAQWVYYSLCPDVRSEALAFQRGDLPFSGCDIYKMNLATREIVQLTFGEWTPNTGAGNWASGPLAQDAQSGENYLGYGIVNSGPCPLPGGKIMFTSNRNGFLPNKSFTQTCLQLYVMDDDGSNVEQIGFLNLGAALHPTVLMDGRVMFSSYEAQGLRDRRVWGLWAIYPDGRNWEPLLSAFKSPQAFHFQTQLSDGRIAVIDYYNLNNNGFGHLLAFSSQRDGSMPAFGSPVAGENPGIQVGIHGNGNPRYTRYPFSPQGIETLTPFTHGFDNAAPLSDPEDPNSPRVGKVTHPAAANDGVLLVYSPGPANDLNRPTPMPYYDAGIYLLANNQAVNAPDELVLIKNDPNYNEQWPRPVLTYQQIYGIPEPQRKAWLPKDQRFGVLEDGQPFGLVGSASMINRNTKPGDGESAFDGLDPFNTSENGASSNWFDQGADAGKYSDDDIFALRVLSMEPTSHRSYGPNGGCCGGQYNFYNHANERLRILGEIPLRKNDEQGNPVMDGDGNPDTSFLVRLPADVPFTFQTLDRNRMVLNASQTWHQIRPGEARYDCGGCHAHAEMPTNFELTAAARPDYEPMDMAESTPYLTKDSLGETVMALAAAKALDVEYHRDIKPILQRSCVPCHNSSNAEAGLVLDDETLVDRHENTYNRLARDTSATYGIPPVINNGTWRQTNRSRYIRAFQSRRSLLVWKVFGERLDGWTNEDHPTESEPGNPATLPDGVNPNQADLDFIGTIMPPPGATHPQSGEPIPALTEDEKMLFATWIDLGAPINATEANNGNNEARQDYGWFLDDLRPTLHLDTPRAGVSFSPLTELRIGAFDYYSGLTDDPPQVSANFSVNGRSPGSDLSDLLVDQGNSVWTLALDQPLFELEGGVVHVSVRDVQGNITEAERSFSIFSSVWALYPLEQWRRPATAESDTNGDLQVDVRDAVHFLTLQSAQL
jgi:hypothetical protein